MGIQLTLNAQTWQSRYVSSSEQGKLFYAPDSDGNVIPDFSFVGYASGDKSIPDIPVVHSISPVEGDNLKNIQDAVNRLAAMPLQSNGFRGTLLLKKGTYPVNGSIKITKSGIVIRGEGTGTDGTIIKETAATKLDLFCFSGSGSMSRQENTKTIINEDFVGTGRFYVELANTAAFKVGDSVLLYRPGTDNWIHDLKMDQIVEREGTVQWTAGGYHLYFERIITSIVGNKVYFDNPVVMQMDKKYGGGFVMKYTFNGRIQNCGIENLMMVSTFQNETDENHGWNAINFTKVNQGWVRNVVSRYFGSGCVYIDGGSRNISVFDSQCLEAKSVITGGRRYSFNCNGQLNLFRNCYTTEGRHDFVTGARVLGPNVFTRCKARNTHSDIGPHHRWACGTLYDIIDTDGEINAQDRGYMGSGHGWAGVTQVIWNCKSPKTAVQSPWVSGKNYCIGLQGGKYEGAFPGRPDGEWEGLNQPGLIPESLYEAQFKARHLTTGLAESSREIKVEIFPNPTVGIFTIKNKESILSFNLFDSNNRILKSGKITGQNETLDCSGLNNGVYYLECSSNGRRFTQKLVVQSN